MDITRNKNGPLCILFDNTRSASYSYTTTTGLTFAVGSSAAQHATAIYQSHGPSLPVSSVTWPASLAIANQYSPLLDKRSTEYQSQDTRCCMLHIKASKLKSVGSCYKSRAFCICPRLVPLHIVFFMPRPLTNRKTLPSTCFPENGFWCIAKFLLCQVEAIFTPTSKPLITRH